MGFKWKGTTFLDKAKSCLHSVQRERLILVFAIILLASYALFKLAASEECSEPFVYVLPGEYIPPPLHPSYNRLLHAITAKDKILLPQLQEDFMTSSVLDDPQCGNWQNRYQELHNSVMNNTAERQKTIMYLCRCDCGGFADRLMGMVSTFMFALLEDRAFLAKWENPFMLEDLFDAPSIDWNSNNGPGDVAVKELNWINYSPSRVDSTFIHSKKSWTEAFPEPHLTFRTNRGIAIRLALSEKYGPRIQELGLTADTVFGCALDYLVKPKPNILQFISKFIGVFRLPSVFSVGIQIRTGDGAMSNPEKDQTPLSKYEHFFTCADQLSRVYAKENQVVVYFLVTDSIHLREEAANRYAKPSPNGSITRHLLVSGVPIAHINYAPELEGMAGTIVEQWVLAATDYRVITEGGYGKIAAFRSRAPGTTVHLTNVGDAIPDCSKPSAFASFESMASVWSLG